MEALLCTLDSLPCLPFIPLTPFATYSRKQKTKKIKGEVKIGQSFYLLEVTHMESSIQLPVGNKPRHLSFMYGAKSCVIKVSLDKRMPKEKTHPRRMQMQVFQPL